jgi:hypothetical protein
VHAHLRIPRFIAQPLVALILISAMLLVGLVASSAAARSAVAQGVSTVAHTWSASSGANTLVNTPQSICADGHGGCP